ncbi:hypothetical protein TFLX_03121 [Thermoflexales bacterium]|nr:hypothetical protein TFLX_03121 [Thermoflexales bacterium]
MPSRTAVTNTLLALTPQQVNDVCEFERFKKWTPELFAMRFGVNLSTANRRLHRLAAAGAIATRVGRPLPGGGRQRDVYYLTALGARMITRLRDRGSDYVTAPDVSNPIDNVHDLTALEVTLRSECYKGARAFQKRTYRVAGETLTIIPDVEFDAPDLQSRFYIEVEQTSRPEHVAEKYRKYEQLFSADLHPDPWLVVTFPTYDTFRLLIDEHEAAAAQAAAGRQFNFCYLNLHELRAGGVCTFNGMREETHYRNGWMDIVTRIICDA